jgi:hypothetical protein
VNRRGEKFPSREREREKITAVGDSSWEFDSASYRTGEEKAFFFVFQRGGSVGNKYNYTADAGSPNVCPI